MSGKENIGDAQLLELSQEEKFIKEHRAMFYRQLAKSDSVTRVFNKTAVIDIEDIYDLNDRITRKLSHIQNAGYIIQANIKFADGKTKTFPDWKSFSDHTWHESESINNMIITWEFNALFPGLNQPERHTLMVKLSNGLRPEEVLNLVFTGKLEDIQEMDNNLFPIVARVDFVDRDLGDELLNIVGEWSKSLRESTVQKSKFMLFLKRNKASLCSTLSMVTNLVVMFASVWATGNIIKTLEFEVISDITKQQLISIIYTLFSCSFVWIFGKKIIGGITDTLYNRLKMYGDNALFNITKGDKNKQNRLKAKEVNSRWAIVGNLLLTIAINIVCGLFVNFIS